MTMKEDTGSWSPFVNMKCLKVHSVSIEFLLQGNLSNQASSFYKSLVCFSMNVTKLL